MATDVQSKLPSPNDIVDYHNILWLYSHGHPTQPNGLTVTEQYSDDVNHWEIPRRDPITGIPQETYRDVIIEFDSTDANVSDIWIYADPPNQISCKKAFGGDPDFSGSSFYGRIGTAAKVKIPVRLLGMQGDFHIVRCKYTVKEFPVGTPDTSLNSTHFGADYQICALNYGTYFNINQTHFLSRDDSASVDLNPVYLRLTNLENQVGQLWVQIESLRNFAMTINNNMDTKASVEEMSDLLDRVHTLENIMETFEGLKPGVYPPTGSELWSPK